MFGKITSAKVDLTDPVFKYSITESGEIEPLPKDQAELFLEISWFAQFTLIELIKIGEDNNLYRGVIHAVYKSVFERGVHGKIEFEFESGTNITMTITDEGMDLDMNVSSVEGPVNYPILISKDMNSFKKINAFMRAKRTAKLIGTAEKSIPLLIKLYKFNDIMFVDKLIAVCRKEEEESAMSFCSTLEEMKHPEIKDIVFDQLSEEFYYLDEDGDKQKFENLK